IVVTVQNGSCQRGVRRTHMRRADRLIDLIGHMRGGRVATAEELARCLGVSVRSVYRDLVTLQAHGVALEGQAGLAYGLRRVLELGAGAPDHAEAGALGGGEGGALAGRVGAAAARAPVARSEGARPGRARPAITARPLRSMQTSRRRAPAFAAALREAIRLRK